MARRQAHLGPSPPRGPHPTRRPLVARKSLPNLERPQHVRPHHAGLPHRHEPRGPTSWSLSGTAPPPESDVNSLPYLTPVQPHRSGYLPARHKVVLPSRRDHVQLPIPSRQGRAGRPSWRVLGPVVLACQNAPICAQHEAVNLMVEGKGFEPSTSAL